MSDKEIIKELDKVINNNKDKAFMTGELNYVSMAESCKLKILDLQTQLQQKEKIIKEVRNKIENTTINCDGVAEDLIDDILEILDKENKGE